MTGNMILMIITKEEIIFCKMKCLLMVRVYEMHSHDSDNVLQHYREH